MRKFISFFIAAMMAFVITACSNNDEGTDKVGEELEKTSTVTIQSLNANRELVELEVPYDPEKIAACEPDIIFIGGRLSSVYEELSAIAPVVYLAVDYEKGVVKSTKDNAKTIASIFGKEDEIDAKMAGFQTRLNTLKMVLVEKMFFSECTTAMRWD